MFKFDFVKNFNKNNLFLGIGVVGIIIAGVLIFSNSNGSFSLSNISLGLGSSNDQIAKKAMDYINTKVLSGQTATLVSTSEESGLVKIKIKIDANEYDTYITKDGKLLFPQVFNMLESDDAAAADKTDTTEPTTEKQAQTCDSLKKTDKPVIEAYVVSKCPFGVQMQRVLADVVKNAPDLAQNILVRYMGSVANGAITSMHGDAEAQENLRQICIRDEQRSKYWSYIECHIKAGDVDTCLTSAGVDKSKLTACTTDKSRGLAYAQEDFDLNTKYSVKGSPTLILNGASVSEFDFGGRTSEALKSIICCSYNSQPGVCSKTLNTKSAATSFSATYESAAGANNSAAGCQ